MRVLAIRGHIHCEKQAREEKVGGMGTDHGEGVRGRCLQAAVRTKRGGRPVGRHREWKRFFLIIVEALNSEMRLLPLEKYARPGISTPFSY